MLIRVSLGRKRSVRAWAQSDIRPVGRAQPRSVHSKPVQTRVLRVAVVAENLQLDNPNRTQIVLKQNKFRNVPKKESNFMHVSRKIESDGI